MASSRTEKTVASTWKLPAVSVSRTVPAVDTEIVPVFQGENRKIIVPSKAKYAEVLRKFAKDDAFQARHGSVQFVRFAGKRGARNVAFVGLGKEADLNPEKLRQAAAAVWARLAAEKVPSAAVGIEGSLAHPTHSRAFLEGLLLNAYSFNKYKKAGEAAEPISRIVLVSADRAVMGHLQEESKRALAVAEAVNITRDWSNEPSNFGTPDF